MERIPEPLLEVLENDDYNNGGAELSASSFAEPLRITILKSRYGDTLSPIDRVPLLIGTAVHKIIEDKTENKIDRLSIRFKSMDIKLSGKIDYYDLSEKTLYDFKITKVYSGREIKKEYIYQLNIYKYLMELNGYQVDKLKLCYIYLDYSIVEFLAKDSYPISPIEIKDVEIMDKNELAGLILIKAKQINEYKDAPDNELPMCDEGELWRSRSLKGAPLRCLAYCPVKNKCDYYINEVKSTYSEYIDKLDWRYL